MFIGHHAMAFAAKCLAPKTSLGTLFVAAMFLDLLWPIFLLAGWEKVHVEPGNTTFTPLAFDSYPYSHSLLMTLVWMVLFALGYWAVKRYRTGALVIGAVVISHWVLDVISHRPDVPVTLGYDELVGLGLWNSVGATLLVELLLFGCALGLYVGTTRPSDSIGRFALVGLAGFLLLLYFGNAFGPPPPGWQAVAWVGLAGWLLPLWAAWFDRHRTFAGSRPSYSNR